MRSTTIILKIYSRNLIYSILEVILEEGNIAISNGCLRPTTETIACFVDGFAMIKEELGEDKFRFYCNDIDWDDDFDDLIFDLEIEKVQYED